MSDSTVASLADQHPGKRYVGWLLWASLLLLIIGLFAPIMTLKKFLFLMMVTIKLGILADVEVHAGVYFFAASVLASMAASLLMSRLVHPGAEAIPRATSM